MQSVDINERTMYEGKDEAFFEFCQNLSKHGKRNF